MEQLSATILAANAFRVLGLPATASQAQMNDAAQKLRHCGDPDRIPPTPWDLPALGKILRTANDVEQAVSQLADPQSRVGQRLLWFSTETAEAAGWGVIALDAALVSHAQSSDVALRHDAALAAVHAALSPDPDVFELARCERAIDGFIRLAQDPAYLAWLIDNETQGGFEKRATRDEIEQVTQSLSAAILELMTNRVTAAVDGGIIANYEGIVVLLGQCGMPQLQEHLLERLEAALDRGCRALEDEIDGRVRGRTSTLFTRHAYCKIAIYLTTRYCYDVERLRRSFQGDAGKMMEGERPARVRAFIAGVYARLGDAWKAAADASAAGVLYGLSAQLAQGTALEPLMRARVAGNSPAVGAQRDIPRLQWLLPHLAAVIVFGLILVVGYVSVEPDLETLYGSRTELQLGTLASTYHGEPRVVLSGMMDFRRKIEIQDGFAEPDVFVPFVDKLDGGDKPVEVFVRRPRPSAFSRSSHPPILPFGQCTLVGSLEVENSTPTFHGVKAATPHFIFTPLLEPSEGIARGLGMLTFLILPVGFEIELLRHASTRRKAERLLRRFVAEAAIARPHASSNPV